MWIIIFVSLGACIASQVAVVAELRRMNQDRMGIKNDLATVKEYLIHRAVTESILKGFGQMNSPWTLSPEYYHIYEPYKTELQALYADLAARHAAAKKQLADKELFWQVARRYSAPFAATICVENGLSEGQCLLGAAYVAKGFQPVDIELDQLTSH